MKHTFRGMAATLVAILLCAGLLAGCTGEKDSTPGSAPPAATEAAAQGYEPGDEDRDDSWDEATSTIITLNGASASISGSGAEANGGTVTISAAGTYVLSGALSDGQVVIDAGKEDLVRLVLNGVAVHSSESAPIYGAKCRKLVVILAEGSENTLTDEDGYTYADAEKQEPDAVLFAKDDLTINGRGSLTVNASFNNGIGSKDNLLLVGGTYSVTAANHGIRGRDSLTILDGSYTVTAGNDGLQSNNDSSNEVGWISIENGSFAINAAHDAVQAESSLTITGGEFDVTTGGGYDASPSPAADESDSYKGLKAGGDVLVTAGAFVLNTADDAVHANGNATIRGGSFTNTTGDDGMHADGDLLIEDGFIDVRYSYEGLEGSTVTIRGGDISIYATDDGINSAGGSDSSGTGAFGGDSFRGGPGGMGDVSEDYYISIEGGTVVVEAAGDGVDSNGNMFMSGGTLLIHGPTSGGDGAIDYELTFAFTGGTIIAAGSQGMAMAPTADASTRPTLMVYYASTQEGGTPLHLADENGNEIVTFVPRKSYQTVVISTPEMQEGESYTLYSGGNASGEEAGGLAAGYTGGTQLTSITLAGMLTSVNDSGEAVSGGMMGGFGPGGLGGMGGGRGNAGEMPDMADFNPDSMELPEGMEWPDGIPDDFDFSDPELPGGFDGERPALPDGEGAGGGTLGTGGGR